MSDRYFQIQNFKWGLDGRRSELLDQPGSLVSCVNAHINSGGEIEQRLSFAKSAAAASANVFGFDATASGLVMFGSDIIGNVTLPAGVSYRQCIHPTGWTASRIPAVMVKVIYSCNYNGNAFVIAEFNDGRNFAYFGDVSPMVLVGEVGRNGVVLAQAAGPETLANLATDLSAVLGGFMGFTATPNVDVNGNPVNGDVILKTLPGLHIGFTPSQVSAAGNLGVTLLDQNNPGTTGVSANASFYISAGSSGTIDLSVGAVDLTGGIVAWQTSNQVTASQVVSAVNARTGITGYSALIDPLNPVHITVNAPASLGATINGTNLTVSITGGTITVVSIAPQPSLLILPNPVNISTGPVQVVCYPQGFTGSAPTFSWSILQDSGISLDFGGVLGSFVASTQAVTLYKLRANSGGVATVQVVVTDAGTAGGAVPSAGTITAQITVTG